MCPLPTDGASLQVFKRTSLREERVRQHRDEDHRHEQPSGHGCGDVAASWSGRRRLLGLAGRRSRSRGNCAGRDKQPGARVRHRGQQLAHRGARLPGGGAAHRVCQVGRLAQRDEQRQAHANRSMHCKPRGCCRPPARASSAPGARVRHTGAQSTGRIAQATKTRKRRKKDEEKKNFFFDAEWHS